MCGPFDQNLNQIEAGLGIQIARRGNQFVITGDETRRNSGGKALKNLYARLELGQGLELEDIDAAIRFGDSPPTIVGGSNAFAEPFRQSKVELATRRKLVEPRTVAQSAYIKALLQHTMVFGIGPAGTGKTYLAVAAAVSLYLKGEVNRIILSRPAVEAGERLGFLPGDMKEKIDPYMQPLYDALRDFLPAKKIEQLIDDGTIEIAPLAFMRGRTLSSAYIVLDEAQNTTRMQMKMFLTRLGIGSRMTITGDETQVDLPRGTASGLVEAQRLLTDVDGIVFMRLSSADVVRNSIVAKIIDAYASAD